MREVVLALRMLRRDWRAGEVRILALAIVVAVASISAVGFFTDRIGQILALQANELLGGDLVIASSQPLPETVLQNNRAAGLKQTNTVEFPSMVLAGERHELAAIKAVGEGYPLRGSVRIASQLFAPDEVTQGIPERGTVWLESRLLSALAVNVGDTITLGELSFTVSALITTEPARAAGNLFSIAPRLLLNIADLAETKLITPASRVRYNTLFAGDAERISAFRGAIDKVLEPGQRLQGIEDARPEVRAALDRASRFLGLSALVSVMLASVAVAMATRRFVSRHLDNCAIMRCLGAHQKTVLRIYGWQMLWLGLVASIGGVCVGYVAQFALVEILGSLAKVSLPPPSWLPVAIGVLTGMVTLLGFAVPPLLHLKDVPTLRVLRRELGTMPPRSVGTYGLGLAVLAALIIWQAQDLKLGAWVLFGTLATVAVLGGLAAILVVVVKRSVRRVGVAWQFGINNLTRRAQGSVVQIVGFGLGLMALLLLSIVRADLLAEWMDRLPDDTPNRFLINIQPDQVATVNRFLTNDLAEPPALFPMVRGRLVAINGQAVGENTYADERAQRLVAREFNLSWGQDLQPDNEIIAGSWWGANAAPQQALSVEEGLAKELGLDMGDSLTFRVAGSEFSAEVTNLRKVDWDTFRVNFFVIAQPGVLDNFPATYITSFYLPTEQYKLLNALLKQFPNVTVIDVAAIMDHVRGIIERVTQAVEYVFLFTLVAGLMVLYAAIQATLDERVRETAILRTLGASRRQIQRGLIAEFVALGLLAGLVAAIAASIVGYVLAERIFHLDYTVNPWLWLLGLIAGGVGVGVAGVLGTRPILFKPPLQTLRGG